MIPQELDLKKNQENNIVCGDFLSKCQEIFGNELFNKWFSNVSISYLGNSEIIVSAPSKFVRDWIIREFLENKRSEKNLLKIASGIDKRVKKISVVLDQSKILDEVQIKSSKKPSNVVNLSKYDNIFTFGSDLNNRFTFANFVSAKYNKFALTMAKIVAGFKNEQMNLFDEAIPLYIHGGIGMGKTHLAQAIAWHIKETNKEKKVVYISAEKFMYHFVQSVRANDMMSFKEQFRSIDMLIIDDVQFIAGKQGTQEEFMQTFNSLIESNKQIVMVCDRHPHDLEAIDEKLKSRISGGMIVNFKSPDFSDRFEILRVKASQLGVEIDVNIIEFIASKITKNIRDLDGVLRKLIANNMIEGEEISMDLAKSIVSEYSQNIKDGQITIAKIQKIVAEHFSIKAAMLSQANRQSNVVKARQIAMFLSKNLTCESLLAIGREFSKNHATVIYAIKSVQGMIESDSKFAREIQNIQDKIIK